MSSTIPRNTTIFNLLYKQLKTRNVYLSIIIVTWGRGVVAWKSLNDQYCQKAK